MNYFSAPGTSGTNFYNVMVDDMTDPTNPEVAIQLAAPPIAGVTVPLVSGLTGAIYNLMVDDTTDPTNPEIAVQLATGMPSLQTITVNVKDFASDVMADGDIVTMTVCPSAMAGGFILSPEKIEVVVGASITGKAFLTPDKGALVKVKAFKPTCTQYYFLYEFRVNHENTMKLKDYIYE